MEIELVEIRDFVSQHHPFDELSIDLLNEVTEMLEARYLRRGDKFPPRDNKTSYLYMIRSGAIELYDAREQFMGRLGEGDLYVRQCQLTGSDYASNHKALEDSLVYQLNCEDLKALCARDEELCHYFEANPGERMRLAATYTAVDTDIDVSGMTIEIGELIKRAPIVLDVGVSIRQSAQAMTEENVSSIMLAREGELAGILTDRDLRRRCVAAGIDFELPVMDIMTADPMTMRSDDLVLNALMTMTRSHINHIPVVDDGHIVGMLTASDLTRNSSANPAYMNTEIRRSASVDELKMILKRLPELQLLLANSGISARHIGETVSSITDVLTTRLIELAQQDLGPEPVPFAWVCGGSQARHEQSSHSDQDNAMILSDEARDEHMPYFAELAKRVCDGLDASGFIYCPGDAMAMNGQWRQTQSVWRGYFREWIEQPEPMALMLSSIFFDLRPVYGDLSLHKELHNMILELTENNTVFIAHMVGNALKHRPPIGFFRTFVLIHDGEHDNTFDLKHRGIVPITDIARVLALAEGVGRVNTSERLKAIAGTPSMSREMSDNLLDALEFIANLRIRHQADQIRRGIEADNFLPPDTLSSLERKHLKDAFEVIRDAQKSLGNRYKLG
ncbi:MAG: cyclic nucleotide-binding/CBS domain-containing protein [Gammaproteobacteria bacterium]|nr:cyclic nucleotide-binding/CBS domain-containing protein [Gammaproteobacteria bacterium]